jgi:hypothetical protein
VVDVQEGSYTQEYVRALELRFRKADKALLKLRESTQHIVSGSLIKYLDPPEPDDGGPHGIAASFQALALNGQPPDPGFQGESSSAMLAKAAAAVKSGRPSINDRRASAPKPWTLPPESHLFICRNTKTNIFCSGMNTIETSLIYRFPILACLVALSHFTSRTSTSSYRCCIDPHSKTDWLDSFISATMTLHQRCFLFWLLVRCISQIPTYPPKIATSLRGDGTIKWSFAVTLSVGSQQRTIFKPTAQVFLSDRRAHDSSLITVGRPLSEVYLQFPRELVDRGFWAAPRTGHWWPSPQSQGPHDQH